jgi:hypothetical protein
LEREKEPSLSSQKSPEPWGLLYILAASAFAFLGWLSFRLNTPRQKLIKSVHPQNSTDYTSEHGARNPNSPIRVVVDSLPAKPPQTEEHRAEKQKSKKTYKILGAIMKVVGALIALGLLGVTYKYVKYTYKMWSEMQTQTCIQREAAVNAERAWVGLDSPPQVEISSLKEKIFTAQINLNVKNFGKGPALNVFTNSQIAFHGHVNDTLTTTCDLIFPFVGLQPSRPVSFDEEIYTHQFGQLIFPNQPPFTTRTTTNGDSAPR